MLQVHLCEFSLSLPPLFPFLSSRLKMGKEKKRVTVGTRVDTLEKERSLLNPAEDVLQCLTQQVKCMRTLVRLEFSTLFASF